jgi:hypothetical protein
MPVLIMPDVPEFFQIITDWSGILMQRLSVEQQTELACTGAVVAMVTIWDEPIFPQRLGFGSTLYRDTPASPTNTAVNVPLLLVLRTRGDT